MTTSKIYIKKYRGFDVYLCKFGCGGSVLYNAEKGNFSIASDIGESLESFESKINEYIKRANSFHIDLGNDFNNMIVINPVLGLPKEIGFDGIITTVHADKNLPDRIEQTELHHWQEVWHQKRSNKQKNKKEH